MELGHERLDVYKLALEVARWAAQQPIPAQRKHLRDQLVRAADSVVLNGGPRRSRDCIAARRRRLPAEGAGRELGDSRRNHFRIAAGSASEVAAVLDLVPLPGGPERQEELRRVVAMLTKLARR